MLQVSPFHRPARRGRAARHAAHRPAHGHAARRADEVTALMADMSARLTRIEAMLTTGRPAAPAKESDR